MRDALLIAVSLTALALMFITVYALVYQALSSRLQQIREDEASAWADRWTEVLFEGVPAPEGPLTQGAIDALLDLREVLRGAPANRAANLINRYGIGEGLLRRVQRRRSHPGLRGLSQFVTKSNPVGFTHRLDALDALAKARLPETFPSLVALAEDREPTLRLMGVRAVARCVASMTSGEERSAAQRTVVTLLSGADLGTGAVEEALLLLDSAAPPVIIGLCNTLDESQSVLLAVVLDAIGRLRLLDLADLVAGYLDNHEPEVRAAALRALSLIGHIPAHAIARVASAANDDYEIVRIQATRCAYLLPVEEGRLGLWAGLGDQSWWVRRSSAWACIRMGDGGAAVLFEAARVHPDRYARNMAVSVLLAGGRVDPDGARELARAE